MSITGDGWEILLERTAEQSRKKGKHRRRTVGTYTVFHDGVAQTGGDMTGMFADFQGPGDNSINGKRKRRIEEGRYALATQDGTKYRTIDYVASSVSSKIPRPAIELLGTGARTEILIHPGQGFMWSVGCFNLCTHLPDASEPITYKSSRRRVISVIEDLKAYLGADFPSSNGRTIPRAHAVVVGEPAPAN